MSSNPLVVVPARFSASASAHRYQALSTARTLSEGVLLAGGEPRFSPFMPFAEHLHGELKREHAFRSTWLAARRARRAGRGHIDGFAR